MPAQQDSNVRVAFGRIVRDLRQRLGLSQEELGERAELHRTYISMVERGIKTPTVVTLVDLARALETTMGAMMTLLDRELTDDRLVTDLDLSRAEGRETEGTQLR